MCKELETPNQDMPMSLPLKLSKDLVRRVPVSVRDSTDARHMPLLPFSRYTYNLTCPIQSHFKTPSPHIKTHQLV